MSDRRITFLVDGNDGGQKYIIDQIKKYFHSNKDVQVDIKNIVISDLRYPDEIKYVDNNKEINFSKNKYVSCVF